jgi:DNA-directed RNA polymerase specialized sigma24 family protein
MARTRQTQTPRGTGHGGANHEHPAGGGGREERFRDLVTRTVAGDESARQALWVEAFPLICAKAATFRLASRLARSVDDRRDVAVDVLERLCAGGFVHLRDFLDDGGAGEGSFPKWLTTLASNATVSHVRAHPEHLGSTATGHCWAPKVPVSPRLEGRSRDPCPGIDARRILEQAPHLLTRAQLEALDLHLLGWSDEEIAGELGLADEHAADRLVHAAVNRLRRRFARGDPGGRKNNRPRRGTDRSEKASIRGMEAER